MAKGFEMLRSRLWRLTTPPLPPLCVGTPEDETNRDQGAAGKAKTRDSMIDLYAFTNASRVNGKHFGQMPERGVT
eukprot:3553173-Pyramimonas_sp.AAC.1